ncbi:hypothetical protein DLP05_149 [Stenotrophomonas phage vB_SmaS_DLP_5]|uniref:Uncharacterized protein n=1 Tax=Stenotrophomonas phage vB_SmaS_DLP_5 TaxID=2044561 RepID=A0A2D2W2U5_9CAUD|nr:hypothetical protein FDJ07_gp072 [Stenotrophomonas phage vB_SmaS_DLP_5]ATS92379.1 hypothetical protein DLP05_149 [Stenotrophomonas phage vB_SmaS_DLP_5]
MAIDTTKNGHFYGNHAEALEPLAQQGYVKANICHYQGNEAVGPDKEYDTTVILMEHKTEKKFVFLTITYMASGRERVAITHGEVLTVVEGGEL